MNSFPLPNTVDITALIIILLGALLGIRRGLSGEIARFVGTITAFVLSLYFYNPAGSWLVEHTRMGKETANATAFVLIVTAVLLITLVIRLILRSIMKISFEGSLEKAGGCIAGFINTTILVLIIFITINMLSHDYLNRIFGKESGIGRIVVKYLPAVQKRVEQLPLQKKVEETGDKVSEKVTEELK